VRHSLRLPDSFARVQAKRPRDSPRFGDARSYSVLSRLPTRCPSYELSMQIHSGVVTFSAATTGAASRGNVVVLALFADDDPCAQAILDLQIQRIGAVYDLSAVNGHYLRFKVRARLTPPDDTGGSSINWRRACLRRSWPSRRRLDNKPKIRSCLGGRPAVV